MIQLGDVARDTVSGFEGVVVATTDWLYGCRRLSLQPQKLHDGKPIDPLSFDEPQCELVQTVHERQEYARLSKTGGPRPEPQRR